MASSERAPAGASCSRGRPPPGTAPVTDSSAASLFVHIKIDPLLNTSLGGERISYSF